jgi:hypothetical protein
MFKSGFTYSHATAKDLDIFVLKVRYKDDKREKLLVYWISKSSGNIFIVPGGRFDGRDNIEIKAEDYKWWSKKV